MSQPLAENSQPPDSEIQVNADSALKKPYVMVLVLAGIAGAMDAVDFRVYGVFTANQAGNLVLMWERLTSDPAEAALSVFSLLGAAVGIATVIAIRMRFPFFSRASGSRALLYLAALLLAVTAFAGVSLSQPLRELSGGDIQIGSSAWWAGALSTSSSAMALAVLGTIFIMVGNQRAQIISGTGPYIDTVRFLSASLLTRNPQWIKKLKVIMWFPIAWSLGAALSSLIPLNRGIIATICAALVCLIAISSRRVEANS
jgi:hypothetical protein